MVQNWFTWGGNGVYCKSQRNELWAWCCLEMEGHGVVLRTSLSSSPTSWQETRVVEDLLTTYASCLIISLLNANSIEPFLTKSISVCTRGARCVILRWAPAKTALFSECMSVSYTVMMLVYAYSGKKIFDPLLILFVCPLTKKLSVISFNGRFIWTVRDRKQHTKQSRKTHLKKSYELICILMSEISIWPLHKTWLSTWWQNPCWQSQRSDVSCSWPPSLRTSQEGFCPTTLCRFSPSH